MSLGESLAEKCMDPIIDTFIKPMLQKLTEESVAKKIESAKIEEHFRLYLENALNNYEFIKTIALRNQSRLLMDLYIPLTLVKEMSYTNAGNFILHNYPVELFENYRHILVVDKAGMGKTTLLKWLFITSIKYTKAYPIFINLRQIDENGILFLIKKELQLIHQNFDEEVLRHMLSNGDFLILFDGYDEIPYAKRNSATKEINEFIRQASSNYIVITSRPDDSLNSINPGLTAFNIRPLRVSEAKRLLRRYDISPHKMISKKLIAELSYMENKEKYKSFLENPLLATLLYIAYDYCKSLQHEKHLFYQYVFEALFYKHDSYKECSEKSADSIHAKKTGLRQSDFDCILRYLSYVTFPIGEVEYSVERFEFLISCIKTKLHFDFQTTDCIYDLTVNINILFKDGLSILWCHKSMQEYFFARYLLLDCGERKIDTIKKIYNKDQFYYQNALSLYASMDIINYERAIMPELMKEYHVELKKIQDNNVVSLLFFYRVYLYFTPPPQLNPHSTIHELAYSKFPPKGPLEKRLKYCADLIDKSIYIEFEQIHQHTVPFEILLHNKLCVPFFYTNDFSIQQKYDEEKCDRTLEWLFGKNPSDIMCSISPNKWSFDINKEVHLLALKKILSNFILDKEIDYDKYQLYSMDIYTPPYDFDAMDPFKEL